MLTIVLKLISGYFIGKAVGRYCAKNELSTILGISLTIACVLMACVLIDKGITE
jgi:hypothetical protein